MKAQYKIYEAFLLAVSIITMAYSTYNIHSNEAPPQAGRPKSAEIIRYEGALPSVATKIRVDRPLSAN